jgi:hypothetical protein
MTDKARQDPVLDEIRSLRNAMVLAELKSAERAPRPPNERRALVSKIALTGATAGMVAWAVLAKALGEGWEPYVVALIAALLAAINLLPDLGLLSRGKGHS